MEQFIEFVGNHVPLFLALAVISGLLVHNYWTSITNTSAVDPARVTELINREDAQIVDVRSMADYAKGHIINAINIPSNGFKDQLHQLQKCKEKEQPIIITCNNGATSGSICKILRGEGFEKIYELKGGMISWNSVNLPLSKSKKDAKKEGKKEKAKKAD